MEKVIKGFVLPRDRRFRTAKRASIELSERIKQNPAMIHRAKRRANGVVVTSESPELHVARLLNRYGVSLSSDLEFWPLIPLLEE